jgi:hypothetical protein
MGEPAGRVELATGPAGARVLGIAARHTVSRGAVAQRLFAFAGGVAVLVSIARAVRAIPGEASIALSHVSGTWAALAVDFARGELYRPVLSASGYGGTRYFPLHFVLHGWLIRAGLRPVAAGHAISLAAVAALVAGAFLLLRRLRVADAIAVPGALLLLANPPVQAALVTIRGDLLSAALNVCGLAASVRSGRRTWLAAPVFAAAILAKETAVYGLAAACLGFAFGGDRKKALKLLASTAFLVLAAILVVQAASDGRFLASMIASASGGATLRTIALAPVRMLSFALPYDVLLVLLAVAALIAVPLESMREVPALYFVATFAVTVVLFGSPGVDENHFLDLDVAAVLLLCVEISRRRLPAAFAATVLALASLAFCASTALVRIEPQRDTVARVIEETRPGSGPLLAENPWIPLLAGERPFLLDSFTLRAIAERNPAMRDDLLAKLDSRFFRAVVLKVEIGTRGTYADWYREHHFGPGFTEALLANYQLVARHGDDFFVYRPKR